MSGARDKGQEPAVTPEDDAATPPTPPEDTPPGPVAVEQLPAPEDAETTWIVFLNDAGERERITVAEYLARGL